MAESYENVLRLVLIILILFFIASAMRIRDNATGSFVGLGSLYSREKPDVSTIGPREALKYGCADTDGGDNILTKGVVYYRVNGKAFVGNDVCEDSKTVLEWACLGNDKLSNVGTTQVTTLHECTSECVDGACVAEKYRYAEQGGYLYPSY